MRADRLQTTCHFLRTMTSDRPGTISLFKAMTPESKMLSNRGVGKRLLNVTEAALYLGLEVDTIYRKARLREIPSVKVGRALRFDLKALERFVEQHTIETID
jgi:excisionase family DNA binding protein